MSPLFIIGNDDISVLEENLNQSRDERERLQLRYNEFDLSLATAQEELEEARTQAEANRQAVETMARQIAMLIEDQSLRRQELDSLQTSSIVGIQQIQVPC